MNLMKRMMGLVVIAGLALATAAQAQDPAAAQAWMAELQSVETKELSEAEVKNVIAAMKDLDGLENSGIDTDSPDMFDAISANNEAMSILKKNDLDANSFRVAVVNIALALGALEVEANRPQIEATLAQMEAMKGQIPEEQFNMIQQQVTGALALVERAPKSNIELVGKYKAELDAIGQ